APFVCDGVSPACPGSCSANVDCGAGFICNCAGQCVVALIPGQSCCRNDMCASIFCVDGVCCNSACGGACDRCDVTGSSGTCTNLAAGSTGSPSCQPYLCSGGSACPSSCAADGDCATGNICNCASRCVAPQANGFCCTRASQCSSGNCVD